MLTQLEKESFWRTVEATLVELFDVDPREAFQKTTEKRYQVAEHHKKHPSDFFYNIEEYDVALQLSERNIDNSDWDRHKNTYFDLKERFQISSKPEIKLALNADNLTIEIIGDTERMESYIEAMVSMMKKLDLSEHQMIITSYPHSTDVA